MKVYAYQGCDSCRKALKWLAERGIPHEVVPVRESPPGIDELRQVLAASGGDIRKLFNVAGGDYREMGMKDRLPTMSEDEALALLSRHGNLVKRPLVVGARLKTAGFKPDEWAAALGV